MNSKVKQLSVTSLQFYVELYLDLVLDIAEHVRNEDIYTFKACTNGPVDPQYVERWAEAHVEDLNTLVEADVRFIRRRVRKEGFSFLTKTLPALGKRIDDCLGNGILLDVPGFRKEAGSVRPKFLVWLLRRIFDNHGKENPMANPDDVLRLRQLTYAFYKLEMGFTDQELAKASSKYCKTEQEIGVLRLDLRNPALEHSSNLIARVCSQVNAVDIIPQHGPGAVATGEKPWEKFRLRRFYPQLEKFYPITDYFFACAAALCDECHTLESLEVVWEPTAKVVFVPKDSRGPRTISCEPVELQWIQQGLSRNLVSEIEKHPYTAGHVNFTDQTVNRRLALYGSNGANWITMDMKDASDRVSLDLVKLLFRKTHLLDYMLACRSTHNLLPSGDRIRLNKFAPMGSALCFPVEALVFWSLIVGLLYENSGGIKPMTLDSKRCPTSFALERALTGVYVYGDDIVIRGEDYPSVTQHLESVGLLVNRTKCCVSGSFRESCGMDAYKGESVTPIKFRTQLPSRQNATQAILSWVQYSNALDFKSYARATARVRSLPVLKTLRLPTGLHDSDPVSFVHYRSHVSKWDTAGLKTRLNKHLHRKEYLCKVVSSMPIYRRCSPWDRSKRVLIRATSNLNNTITNNTPPRGGLKYWSQALSSGSESASLARLVDRSLPEVQTDVNRFSVRDRITLKSRWCALD